MGEMRSQDRHRDEQRSAARPRAELGRALRVGLMACFLVGAPRAEAIVLAPHALFIDHHTRSGILYVQNPGDDIEEVSIELEYGYPASDSVGGVYIQLISDPPPGAPSAAEWMRALPQKIRVLPGARQAVRLLAQPPADLPDGEYWSRIIVTSHAAQAPVPVSEDQSVRVGLTLEMRTITSLIYRKGEVSTGVELKDFAVESAGDTLVAAVKVARRGTGAYLGRVEFVLTDQQGHEVGGWEQAIAVYFDLFRRYSLPTKGLAPGPYTLAVRLVTERTDIAQAQLLPAEPVERKVSLLVPSAPSGELR